MAEDAPVFVISVAAQLSGLHAQTLRAYDRLGLVSPGRTSGGGRRYSMRDIELLRQVAQLTAAGYTPERQYFDYTKVVVDLAVESGGNCALSKPGEVVEAQDIEIDDLRVSVALTTD